jgi:hypothetical protein
MNRTRIASVLFAVVALVVTLGVVGRSSSSKPMSPLLRYVPIPGSGESAEGLGQLEGYWNDRVTYPTGKFDPLWVRRAASQDGRVERAVPEGRRRATSASTVNVFGRRAATASIPNFTSLGPKPEHMSGCSGCYDYGTTAGRINNIAIDPTTTTAGSIVAYAASVGGGVWKTTNCCSTATSWTAVTDDPLISSTSIDAVTIDPNDHNTVYAGTGDLNYGSFSMGSQGVLKTTDGGAHWTVLGGTTFGPAYSEPAGQFPQYDAVGKVRVDPNNSSKVIAGTKKGLFLSYDGGASWTGPCTTNGFATQRQDITGLELTNVAGGTRILAAVGVRGFATTVQYDLGNNGANGIYSATMPASGCPSFTSIAGNANGFTFGTTVTGSPYPTGANLNAGSGVPYANTSTGDQLGRIELGVAPSNPNVIYAQVQSIALNNNSGCGNANGCQLGVWSTADGGASWSFMAGSAGGALRNCGNAQGDYPQNWYDQAVAVDPNNADRVFISTFDVWFATRTGTAFNDITCGYNGTALANHVVHVDQHALAFVPGSSGNLVLGNDGGVHGTVNAGSASATVDPTWVNMDTGLNTIEFYSGDISGNFATSASPIAVGGAQDNGPSSVMFTGYPTGPAQWQMGLGGDGFMARVDPVGTGTSLRLWQGNNSGGLSRCTNNCTASGASWTSRRGNWTGDQQSFILPFDLFHGGIAGGDDCGVAGATTGCGDLIAGTTRVWETITGATGTNTWVVTNNAATPTMIKVGGPLGARAFINQVKYAPKFQSVAMAGVNDGGAWIGFNLGTGVAGAANWVNVTGSNTVLPNRPVLGIALDPSVAAANIPIGYAAVGGFNGNTPSTPGHVFRVVCTALCASFTWQDKSGNLPDIPVDSIIVNPRFPQQVFAGSDFGLYFTNDINAASPTWYRFKNGMPNSMIWDLQIDRGSTALSVWTRGRGAYAWPLSDAPAQQEQTITFGALADKTYGNADFDVSAAASSGLSVAFTASGKCTVSGSTVHLTGAGSCTVTASQSGSLDYNPAPDVTRSFSIGKADQTIDFGEITAKTFGDPDFPVAGAATSGLAVSLAASGDCTVSAGVAHITAAGSCTITASQDGNDDYNAAPAVVRTFAIAKADQTIELGAVDDKTFGDADFELTGSATSGLDVSLEVTSGHCTLSSSTAPAHVHISGAGACEITATQGGNGNYNPAPDEVRSFTISKANQTIDFGDLGDKTWGDHDFDVSATATSGLHVSFAAAGNCEVADGSVHITGAGTCTITASQSGNDDYNPAPDVSHEFTIGRADQSIDFAELADKTYNDADFAIGATASSSLSVSFEASGHCILVDAKVHITGAGSCTITASQPGNDNFMPADNVTRTFTIRKDDQSIDFAALGDKTYGDADFDVSATADSGLEVSFAASGDCIFVGSKVDITGAGSCTITASQPGDDNYNAAPDVSRSFTIDKADQKITFEAVGGTTFGDADFEIDASAASGLSVALAATGPCILSSAVAPASVHVTGAGTCTITASQGGNSNYNAAPDVARSFAIARANQTIAFAPLADKTYGDPDFTVSATASSGLPVSFAASGSCTVTGASVHITSVGFCTVTASQSGNADFNAAPDVGQRFNVAWTFSGFFQPIDNGVVNVAQAGSSIPVKFGIGGSYGLAIFAAASPASVKVGCVSGSPEDTIEQTSTPGQSTLSYDAGTGQYHYVWKTDKAWSGTCRTLTVKLVDNTVHTANFRFK